MQELLELIRLEELASFVRSVCQNELSEIRTDTRKSITRFLGIVVCILNKLNDVLNIILIDLKSHQLLVEFVQTELGQVVDEVHVCNYKQFGMGHDLHLGFWLEQGGAVVLRGILIAAQGVFSDPEKLVRTWAVRVILVCLEAGFAETVLVSVGHEAAAWMVNVRAAPAARAAVIRAKCFAAALTVQLCRFTTPTAVIQGPWTETSFI